LKKRKTPNSVGSFYRTTTVNEARTTAAGRHDSINTLGMHGSVAATATAVAAAAVT